MTEMNLGGEYLVFLMKGQYFGIKAADVHQINQIGATTQIPSMPKYVLGVMNFEEKIVPIVDLRLKFGMEALKHSRESCVVVITGMHGLIGIVVDQVKEVQYFRSEQIENPPVIGDLFKQSFVMGMGKIENQIVLLIDIVQALAAIETPHEESIPEEMEAAA